MSQESEFSNQLPSDQPNLARFDGAISHPQSHMNHTGPGHSCGGSRWYWGIVVGSD